MRAGAWPHAAASTSQLRISWRAVATTRAERRFAVGRVGPARRLAGREHVEELGVEVRDEPGLGGDDDAAAAGLEGLPARPALEPGRHEVAVVVGRRMRASRGRAARARAHPTRSPRRACRCGPARGRARGRAAGSGASRAAAARTCSRPAAPPGTSRSARRYCTACVIPWSIGQPAGERHVQLVPRTTRRADHGANDGSAGSGTFGRAVLTGRERPRRRRARTRA